MIKHKNFKKLILIMLLPLGFLIAALASKAPGTVEAIYSRGFYRLISQIISTITGILPFSLAEILIISLVIFVLWKLVNMIIKIIKRTEGAKHIALNSALNLLMAAGVIYFIFITVWGLNYHRQPFANIAGFEVKPASSEELAKVCDYLINQANLLRSEVTEDSNGVMTITGGYPDVFNRAVLGYQKAAEVYPQLGGNYGKPKPVFLSGLMSYTGIWGVCFPFTLEANVNTWIPYSNLPSTTCHEMAHIRGFSREDEANFIAYLACSMHPDADFRYSGTFMAMTYAMNSLYSHDEERYFELSKKRSAGVMRDYKALDEFNKQFEGPIEKISTQINNAYLKANMQQDGVRSYGRMVDLLIAEYRHLHPSDH